MKDSDKLKNIERLKELKRGLDIKIKLFAEVFFMLCLQDIYNTSSSFYDN